MENLQVICKLKELMEAKEISQMALAEKTGLAPSTIGRLYRNQVSRIDTQTVTTLCNFFNLSSLCDLFEIVKN